MQEREKAYLLEKKAIQERDLLKKTSLFLNASKIYNMIDDPIKTRHCKAEYYLYLGDYNSHQNKFKEARYFYSKAEKFFKENSDRKGAFFARSKYCKSYRFESKVQGIDYMEYTKSIKNFLEEYSDFSDNFYYIEHKLNYYINKTLLYAKSENYFMASEFARKTSEYADMAYKAYPKDWIKKRKLINEAFLWEYKSKMENENYIKKAKFLLNAAMAWEKVGNLRNAKYNYANYYSSEGMSYLSKREYYTAMEYFKKSKQLFEELGISDSVFYALSYYYQTYSYAIKSGSINDYEKFFTSVEDYLNSYKQYSDNDLYSQVMISYYMTKSKWYRQKEDYENALKNANACIEYVEAIKKQNPNSGVGERPKGATSNHDRVIATNKAIYWNIKAKQLKETTKNFLEIADAYKKSAQYQKEVDEDMYYDACVNYYKYLAIANKYDRKVFIENIEKAIYYANKRSDDLQINYLMGLKYDHLASLAKEKEKTLEYLAHAKENYYKAGAKELGAYSERAYNEILKSQKLKEDTNTPKCSIRRSLSKATVLFENWFQKSIGKIIARKN